jgi:TPR repeat protein
MKTSAIINKIQIQKVTDKTLYVLNFEENTQICCKEEIGLYSYQDNLSHVCIECEQLQNNLLKNFREIEYLKLKTQSFAFLLVILRNCTMTFELLLRDEPKERNPIFVIEVTEIKYSDNSKKRLEYIFNLFNKHPYDIEEEVLCQEGNKYKVSNPNLALDKFLLASRYENPEALTFLWEYYYNEGNPICYDYLLRAVKQNDSWAMKELADCYEHEPYFRKDKERQRKAFDLYFDAAFLGESEAMYRLAEKYYYGFGDIVDENRALALYWLRKHENTHPTIEGQYLMGMCMWDKDLYHEAFCHFMFGAEYKYFDSLYMIGLSYELGYGVYKDNDLALKYYLKAYETEGGEPESVIELYIHLGKVLYHMKSYDEALKYLDYAHKEIRYNTPDLDRVNNLIMACVNAKKDIKKS